MKLAIKARLLISMILLGILFGVLSFFLTNQMIGFYCLVICILLGITFGFMNYFVCYIFIKKYILLKRYNETLQRDVNTDALTGLYNRRAFNEDLKSMAYNDRYSMIFIDIDNFRKFNNDYGHYAGDNVLRKVSATIYENINSSDKAYRYGGEEIVIILKGIDKQNTRLVAEKIRKDIEQLDNSPYPNISASLGISSYPADGINSFEVLRSCDKALLTAKRYGKNQTCSFSR